MADATPMFDSAPSEAEMVEATRSTLQALLADEANGLSQSDISREANVSSTTLSRFLKGDYKGDNAGIATKLSKWLETRRARLSTVSAMPTPPAYINTGTAQRILDTLEYAQAAGDMAVVYGGAGLGKTTATKRYASTAASVWVVEMTRSHGKLLGALERIAVTIGLRGIPRESAKVQDRIHDRVADTGGLLVIDEAQHLENDALEAIRAIHDATGIGVVLLGNEVLYSRLTGGKRDATFAQLFSRIGKRVRLGRPVAQDVDAVADAWGLNDSEARDLLHEIAGKPGALRGATKCLRLASVVSAGQIRGEHLRTAWTQLGGAE